MHRIFVTTALLLLLGGGTARAADPTVLAEMGGFLLGNAKRCGVAADRVEQAGKVLHDFMIAAAEDSNQIADANSRFAEIFEATARLDQDPDAFPSCIVVIDQFDRLERHHEQLGKKLRALAESRGF